MFIFLGLLTVCICLHVHTATCGMLSIAVLAQIKRCLLTRRFNEFPKDQGHSVECQLKMKLLPGVVFLDCAVFENGKESWCGARSVVKSTRE